MGFDNRTEFITAQSSEKFILAHVHGVQRLFTWTLDSGAVYKRVTDHFVTALKEDDTVLTQVSDIGSVVAGTWFFDSVTSTLYTELTGSTDPQTTAEMIVTYRFFYGNGPTSASWDLSDTGNHVHYEGRITFAPPFKHRVGVDQSLVSVIGNGTLKLHNTDGSLDDIYDKIIFDNQEVRIYSWNRDLNFSDARIIYRGRVTNKRYQKENVAFLVKDLLFDLEQNIPQDPYTAADNVSSGIIGRYKRWIYGRVDGLRLQSTSQIGDGIDVTGTVSAGTSTPIMTGVGTSFISQLSPSDSLTIGTQEFTITSIESDTQLTLDDIPEYSFSSAASTFVPTVPVVANNREFLVAGHASARLTKTVVNVIQFNRVELSDTIGIVSGDFLEFATLERVEVKNVAPGNIVVLRQNLILIPSVSSSVVRQPVQSVFLTKDELQSSKFTISNTSSDTKITIADDSEFTIARTVSSNVSLTYTNGSRILTYAGTEDLREIFNPRDYLRPKALTFTTYYEILSVGEGYTLSGTISGDTTTTTITGVGTLFTTELSPGDSFKLGEEDFTVDTITNNLELVVDNAPNTAYAAVIGRVDDDNAIELRVAVTDPNHTGPTESKHPNYVGDDTVVSANVLGRTADNTPDGTWIQTAADAMLDIITQVGIVDINTATFTAGAAEQKALISMAIPASDSGSQVTAKTVIDSLAVSTKSAITLDNDLKIKYLFLNAGIPDDVITIHDNDIYEWSIESTNGFNIRNTIVNYSFKDVDRFTQEAGNSIETYESEFVKRYVGTNKTDELNVNLYDQTAAEILSHRHTYLQSLGRNTVKFTTDLRLEDLEIGDVVIIELDRLYKRFGDADSRKKALMIIGKKVTGERVQLEAHDLGNIFNRSSVITPNDAPDYNAATDEEKVKYGYITANNGITDDDENTANIHLIS